MALQSARLEACLGGWYRDAVLDSSPLGLWLLNEQLLPTGARDRAGNTPGTYANAFAGVATLGSRGPFPHGGTAVTLDGLSSYVTMGDVPLFSFANAFSAEFVLKTTFTDGAIVGKLFVDTPAGWGVWLNGFGQIEFYIFTAAGAVIFDTATTLAYNDDLYHHVVCTWNGTTGANKVKIYVDGVVVKQDTVGPGTPATNTARLLIGAADQSTTTITKFLSGDIAGVALYNRDLSAAEVAAHAATLAWTDLTDDVDGDDGIAWRFGIPGNTPLDRIAAPGAAQFTLVHETEGYYSPHHDDHRAGFARDIPIRVVLVDDGDVEYVRFWGRLVEIDAQPGLGAMPRTACIAQDFVWQLVENKVRSIAPQINKAEDELIRTVFEALPDSVQPMAVVTDPPLDVFPVAFDKSESGIAAVTALAKPVINAWGKLTVRGDGTAAYRSRSSELLEFSSFTFDDAQLKSMTAPSTLDNVFNLIRVTVHPKEFGATDTEVLFSTAEVISIEAGDTIDRWFDYSDPNNRNQKIGGTDFQDPLVSGTDYAANTAADGSGSNITADIDISSSFFASTVKLTITNNNAATAYLVTTGAGAKLLQVRGRGIYDLAEVTAESMSGKGDRGLDLDLEFQGSGNVAQALADYIRTQYESLERQVDELSFEPDNSDDNMDQALLREPGDIVSVSEGRTGIDAQLVIQSIELKVAGPFKLSCAFGVAPKLVGEPWILDDAVFSLLEDTTVLAHG